MCTSLTAINVDAGNSEYSSQDGVVYTKDKTGLIICPGGITGAFTIPVGVTGIRTWAFQNCTSLTSVTMPNSVTMILYCAFSGCTGLTSVTIPNSVTFIGESAFSSCTGLTSVTFQGTITSGNLHTDAFGSYRDGSIGDLRDEYLAGGIGTYTRSGGRWTKQ